MQNKINTNEFYQKKINNNNDTKKFGANFL